MDRKFGLIALVFIILAIIGIAMVENVAAAKYGVVIVTVYEKTTSGEKIRSGADVELKEASTQKRVAKGKTDFYGQLHIPTVVLGKDYTIYAEKNCGSKTVPQLKTGTNKFKMSKNQQNVKIVLDYVRIGPNR